jgi:hypothetical protein
LKLLVLVVVEGEEEPPVEVQEQEGAVVELWLMEYLMLPIYQLL